MQVMDDPDHDILDRKTTPDHREVASLMISLFQCAFIVGHVQRQLGFKEP